MSDTVNPNDPKGMTASELLRKAAADGGGDLSVLTPMGELFNLVGISITKSQEDVFIALADMIDAELARGFNEGCEMGERRVRTSIELDLAAAKDWPRLKIDETIREYLDRCFIPRPAPEVLGADGLPIVEGETVWDTGSGKELNVCAIANAYAGLIQCSDDDGVCEDYDARHLIHNSPDTQERIDADMMKRATEYWMCGLSPCAQCPVRIDGKTPAERYETGEGLVGCRPAMLLDLLRRQRELDKRTGGEQR